MTEEERTLERETGYWVGVIDNLQESLSLQHGQPSIDLNLYAWDVQVLSTALVRLSLDLRNKNHSAETTQILSRELQRQQNREVRVSNLSLMDDAD